MSSDEPQSHPPSIDLPANPATRSRRCLEFLALFNNRNDLITGVDVAEGNSVAQLYHKYFFTPAGAEGHRSSLTPGDWGHELCEELDVRDEDIRAWKTRHSAFVHGHGNLHELLQEAGIENLLIGGTVTNFCCETTGRDAMMNDYRAVMVSDCNAARFPEDHSAGLTTFFQSFGDVYTSDEVIAVLKKGKELKAST